MREKNPHFKSLNVDLFSDNNNNDDNWKTIATKVLTYATAKKT